MRPNILLLLPGLLIVLMAGCRSAPTGPRFDARAESVEFTNVVTAGLTNQIQPEWLRPSPEPFRLGPGDVVEIEMFGEPDSRITSRVGPDGRIYFYLLPGLNVWGLTLPETRALLESELGHLFQAAPPPVSVALRTIESQRVWLLGRVQNAGVYPVSAPMTLLESIALAGGLQSNPGMVEDLADLNRSFIVREGRMLPINMEGLLREGDMSQNIYVQPDDFIYVPSQRVREAFILGAVRTPSSIPVHEHSTLVSALASVGGSIPEAYLAQVAIVRGSLAEPRVAVVDYKAILAGRAPDVRVQAGDIIYVPLSPYRHLTRYVNLIVDTFVRAVAINEGARAATRDPIPVGVNIGTGVSVAP
jgi:polysaccharide biosynthesis/export protein